MTVKIGTNIHLLNDFTPGDYYPWTYYIFFVNKKNIKDVGELRQQIVEEWEQLGQHVIDNVIRQWCRRLRGCVDVDSGQFEHYD